MVMSTLTALGIGIISFAIVIGVGTIVVLKMSAAVADCDTAAGGYYNSTSQLCHNVTGTPSGTNSGSTGLGTNNLNYMETQLSSSGLAGWTPAIIALAVGMLFLGAFVARKGSRL